MKKIKIIASAFIIGLFFVSVASVHADVPTESVLIRNGDTVVYQGTVNLPTSGTVSINDNTGTPHLVNADSVLGLIYSISQSSSAFTISNLQYYSSFGSLYLKCLTPSGGSESCDNWQYVVNSTTPATGMDTTVLSGGETVGLYFGPSDHIKLDKTSAYEGDVITARAEKYNYLSNSWEPLTGVTIGVTTPNPNDPYNPTVIITKPVETNGELVFSAPSVGAYNVGIAEDYYYPLYPITVLAKVISSGGGATVSFSPATPAPFNIQSAIGYLENIEATDGSFEGSDMYTDWASIALGAGGIKDSVKTKILNYMTGHNVLSTTVTDNERRAMALLSLDENPYSFHDVNYIESITKSFDGKQFGDASLVNDDIFALIPLENAGYKDSDEIISKDATFIISKQKENGSWEDSIDLTAAAIQALKPVSSITGVTDAINKAGKYLENSQGDDGGFGSVSSTSWVAQAMNTLGLSWTKNGKNINDYFNNTQTSDGAVLPTSETNANRVWATSYAIPAVLGKPWNAIMQKVEKPIEKEKPVVEIKNTETKIFDVKVPHKIVKENKKINPKPVLKEQSSLTASAVGSGTKTSLPKAFMNGLDSLVNGFMSVMHRFF